MNLEVATEISLEVRSGELYRLQQPGRKALPPKRAVVANVLAFPWECGTLVPRKHRKKSRLLAAASQIYFDGDAGGELGADPGVGLGL
jgi:hypothetical protein